MSDFVIVRSYGGGVFFGRIHSRERLTYTIVLNDCRRLWYWAGAFTLSALAMEGTTKPSDCKFSCRTQGHEVAAVLEVIPCTEKAASIINEVSVWTG